MTKVNDEQIANLTIAVENIRLIEATLPKLASQVRRMSEENKNQRKHLTDL